LTISSDTNLLAGIDTSGMVWKQNIADEWVRGGKVSGTPQAVTVFGNRLYVAGDSGIAFSDDEGTSWTVIKMIL
jgi:cyanophycinase-like exopeptidase